MNTYGSSVVAFEAARKQQDDETYRDRCARDDLRSAMVAARALIERDKSALAWAILDDTIRKLESQH
ncbi:MAG: hypothetical protein ACFB6S_19300 [Geminicoccaceae bacterium]